VSLQQQGRAEGLRVRWVRADAIAVEDRELQSSFLLTGEGVNAWAPTAVHAITETDLQPVLDHAPQVLLLGTGTRQRFLAPLLMAGLMRQGIGVECMDNAAAARTFNLLADEGRKVMAAFLMGE